MQTTLTFTVDMDYIEREAKQKLLQQTNKEIADVVEKMGRCRRYQNGQIVEQSGFITDLVEQKINDYCASDAFAAEVAAAVAQAMPIAIKAAAEKFANHMSCKATFSKS